MEIPEVSEFRAIKPEEVVTTPTPLTVRLIPEGIDCMEISERETKNGKGKFKQYSLHVVFEELDEPRIIRYLFPSDLAPLVKAWGTDSKKWLGKRFIAIGVQDGKYHRFKFEPENA